MTGASASSADAKTRRWVRSRIACANLAPGPAVAVAPLATRHPAIGSTCPADANTSAPLAHVATLSKSAVELAWSCRRRYACMVVGTATSAPPMPTALPTAPLTTPMGARGEDGAAVSQG